MGTGFYFVELPWARVFASLRFYGQAG